MKSNATLFIGVLATTVVVLGYLYYQRTQNDITIQLPKIELNR